MSVCEKTKANDCMFVEMNKWQCLGHGRVFLLYHATHLQTISRWVDYSIIIWNLPWRSTHSWKN
jgi:hypothetical protein